MYEGDLRVHDAPVQYVIVVDAGYEALAIVDAYDIVLIANHLLGNVLLLPPTCID